jgi:two-component system, OmpR family, sensor kinase
MIRRRLVLTIVALVIAITGATGVLALSTLRDRQVDEIEQELRAADRQAVEYLMMIRGQDMGPPSLEAIYEPFPHAMRRVAYVLVNSEGAVVWSFPSGTTRAPDPLPDVTALPPDGEFASVGSVDSGGPRYRVLTRSLESGGTLVMGISIATAEETLASVSEILVVSGALALVLVATAVWLTVRRGLRPIEQMVATARNIAQGDLSHRAPNAPGRGEVAELGTALNTMLDRIEESFEVKVASEAQMRRFVADASHELRTPLTSIRGYAELYRRGASDDPDAVALGMARIEHEATRMTALVDDLLLLARLDQGRPLACDPVDLVELVAEAAQSARLLEPGRPMAVDVPDRPATVDGDSHRLRQVVDNLLANVRTHTGPTTPVDVTLTTTADAARITVSDGGPGMSADQVARAFERFYRAEPHRPGSGIGLSIVAELVDAHRGSVVLDSEPGRGTTVVVTLPLSGRTGEPAAGATPAAAETATSGA